VENNNNTALTRKGTDALMKKPELQESVVSPVADIYETSEAFIAKLDMPGAVKEAIQLQIDPDRISIRGTVAPRTEEGTTMLYNEIGRKQYFREFNLSKGIDVDNITAQFENGVLTITLPKTDEAKAKDIPIH
jgi:HSP20 family protein